MSDGLILDPFLRALDAAPADDPWPVLEQSGYLDLLKPEAEGGAGLELEALYPLAFAVGRRPADTPVIEAMIERAGDLGPAAEPLAAAAAAATMAGAMAEIVSMTVDYARTRRQFGREIGRFQAVQHQIAEMAEAAAAAAVAAEFALVGPAGQIAWERAAAAKICAGRAAEVVGPRGHAVHGAIGISDELDLWRFTRRLWTLRQAHGGEPAWARRLGAAALKSPHDITTLARQL